MNPIDPTDPAKTDEQVQPQPEAAPPQTTPIPPEARKPITPAMLAKVPMQTKVIVIGVAVVLVLFALQSWASGRSMAAERRAGLVRCADALSAALTQSMLDNNLDRTQRTLIAIANGARFEEVTIVDPGGNITASTNSAIVRKSIVLPKDPPLTASVSTRDGRTTVLRAIAIGGNNVMGVLRIVAKDGD